MRAAAKNALTLLPNQETVAVVQTESGSRYLQQLCKHWSHKAAAEFDATHGTLTFDSGNIVEMQATPETLTLTAKTGPRGDLDYWAGVVQRHIERFAFRETLSFDWTPKG
ncbi:DUF2218 domain-containing protein [Cognatishimia sp. SS12]|nr:DUF2218 domain-containing protein [Cognatishimia sp. SS12]MDC0739632.1 DUF2218 domain-containing protein [Cognatishimia sp. SS12]